MPGRWKPVAEDLINIYNLTSESKVLDIGCGKAYLLYEMKLLIPDLDIAGIDSSDYGLENAKDEMKPFISNIRQKLNYHIKTKNLICNILGNIS